MPKMMLHRVHGCSHQVRADYTIYCGDAAVVWPGNRPIYRDVMVERWFAGAVIGLLFSPDADVFSAGLCSSFYANDARL